LIITTRLILVLKQSIAFKSKKTGHYFTFSSNSIKFVTLFSSLNSALNHGHRKEFWQGGTSGGFFRGSKKYFRMGGKSSNFHLASPADVHALYVVVSFIFCEMASHYYYQYTLQLKAQGLPQAVEK